MYNSLIDHMGIFFSNLTWFYFLSTLFSFCAVIGTTVLMYFRFGRDEETKLNVTKNKELQERGLQARYKLAQQKVVEQKLTPHQRDMEKELESQTLSAVLELLQKRSDMLHVSTMDELKEQLNLYRHQ